MSIADRPRAEIVERLRLTESQLVVTTQRAEAAERKLALIEKDHLMVGWDDPYYVICKRPDGWSAKAEVLGRAFTLDRAFAQIDKALAQIGQPQRSPIPPVHPMAGIAAIDRKAQYEEEAEAKP